MQRPSEQAEYESEGSKCGGGGSRFACIGQEQVGGWVGFKDAMSDLPKKLLPIPKNERKSRSGEEAGRGKQGAGGTQEGLKEGSSCFLPMPNYHLKRVACQLSFKESRQLPIII